MVPSATKILVLAAIAISGMSYLGAYSPAFALTSDQIGNQTITGNDLKNNPMVAKILSEIEYSKKQIAELQKNQKDQEENQKLIAQQRLIAKQLEEQAYQILQTQTAQNSSDNAYDRFLDSVSSNDTKKVFHDEFAFTKQRVDAGHAAMQKVLANGGTWEQAMQEFSNHAAIRYVEMISVNQALNDKYIHHQSNATIPFDQYGKVPDGYITVPETVSRHDRT
ncbi:MAG TPA: hypothetical protein VFW99_04325 [Candidatus Nitrosotalea sp.]|nr:hypothetical protein [Candidatus Nitrosotalea sp.]